MKKKALKIFSIFAGIVFLLILIGNFWLNFWLKKKLPDFIKNNSEYLITYKTLDVHLGTGNIFSTGLSINNQNPDNQSNIGLQGTVDTLSVSRLGIYDLLFNKRINTNSLTLKNPNLNIVLAKPFDQKTGKKKSPFNFENIKITNGNIQIFRSTKQKILSVKALDLMVENLKFSEKPTTKKLPFVFDNYTIKAKNLFFRPDQIYAFTAQSIATTDGQMNVKEFAMIPLLSYQNFLKYYPKKQNLYDVKATEMSFKDFIIKNNQVALSDVKFENPQLKIGTTKAKSIEEKKSFDYDINLENILFNNAKIDIRKPDETPLFTAENLTLQVSKLEMNEETAKGKIPFKYEHFDIKGKHVNYVSENENIKIGHVAIHPKQVDLQYISVKPTAANSKKTILNLTALQLYLKINNGVFINDKLKLDIQNVLINQLNGAAKIVKNPQKKKPFFASIEFPLTVQNVVIKNSNVEIDTENQPLILKDLNANIKNLELNDETLKNTIPFKTGYYSLTTRNFNYKTKIHNITASLLKMNRTALQISNFAIKPTTINSHTTSLDLKAQQLHFKIKNYEFINNKLKLDIQNVLVNQLNGSVKTVKNLQKKKPIFAGIAFPLTVRNVEIKNSNVEIDSDNQPFILKDLNANFQNMEMNAETIKESIPFKTGNYSLTTKNFNYKTKFYNLSASLLKLNKNALQVSNFLMKPTVSRAQYIRMIPTEKDLYDLKINQLNATGKWDLVSKNKYLDVENITLNSVDANIFRSKIPNDDLSKKPMYSQLLRSIKFPVFVRNLDVKNSLLVYEEDTKKSDGPGKLTFNNLNINVKNLNSAKMKGKPTQVPIAIQCRFMNASPLNVRWTFDTANTNDVFAISGNISDLSAARINPFIEPYLKIRATGLISDLVFNFKGTQHGINGSLKLVRQDLKISILKKSGEKDKVISTIANLFVKSNSGNQPETVSVENVERNKTKSFFNLFWSGIELGLKKTLLGKNAPKTEQSIKNTVDNTKSALKENKKDLEQVKKDVEKVQEKGVLRNLFKKKSDSK